ncbi:MAG: C40 family peptidase [Muribaculaceae bacterium]
MNLKSYIFTSIIVAIVMIFAASSATAQELAARKHGTVSEQMQQSQLYGSSQYDEIRELLDYAATFKGTRYRRGSSSPKGFDCSGFTSFVFKKFGYELNRSSRTQVNNGTPVAKNELQPGDLVFFNGRAVGKRVGHVGIVTEVKDDGKFEFIHSSNGRGVVVSSSEEPYYKRRYVGASRVISADANKGE